MIVNVAHNVVLIDSIELGLDYNVILKYQSE